MISARFLPLFALTLMPGSPARAQSVVSTHSGLIYFFDGTVFVGDERLEQKFGRFPDLGVGGELRTGHGLAEILLTPGTVLRIDENSSVRMVSNQLSDTRVELLRGSAILEANEAGKDHAATLIYRDWEVRVPDKGVYRIDSEPSRLRVYKGEAEVASAGQTETTTVREGEALPLGAMLLTERAPLEGSDAFKNWAMTRSDAISADNAIAAEIVDDPPKPGNADLDLGGFSYFPLTGIPSLGITNPYGLSFWSPYQSSLTATYLPGYMYGPYLGWPSGSRFYPRRVLLPAGIGPGLRPGGYTGFRPGVGISGMRPGGITAPRPVTPAPRLGSGRPAPHVAGHAGGRR